MMKFFYFSLFYLLTSIVTEFKSQVTYNGYAQVTVVTSGTILGVANANITNHNFNVGEQVIVMQMQDNTIGTNTANTSSFGNLGSIANAGKFEVSTITSVSTSAGSPTRIAISPSLTNTYNTGANTAVQVITFRKLNAAAFTTTANITGIAWNGTIGGVIALEVGTDFTLNHSISANGLGFRGGSVSTNYWGGGTTCSQFTFATSQSTCGYKGEGIFAATSSTQTNGVAKILNGGGGGGRDVNGGGGGGGNYTSGGSGGAGWNSGNAGCIGVTTASGQGGITLSVNISASQVFMGGGVGGGQQNDGVGSAGGRGGGIVLIKANRIVTGTGCSASPTVSANGVDSPTCSFDGAGGGGAAGSIIFQVNSFSVNATCPLKNTANGGDGGDVNFNGTHAGGGAGAQGVVIYSSVQPTLNTTTQTNNGAPGCAQTACTITAGSAGGVSGGGIVASSSGVLPIKLLYFKVYNEQTKAKLTWKTLSEKDVSHFVIRKTIDGVVWIDVCKVLPKGDISIGSDYLAYDSNLEDDIIYYQLITINKDQSEDYHNIEFINRSVKPEVLKIYPNPTSGIIMVELQNSFMENAQFQLMDITGRVYNLMVNTIDKNKFKIDLSMFQGGIYFLQQIRLNGLVDSYKIILAR